MRNKRFGLHTYTLQREAPSTKVQPYFLGVLAHQHPTTEAEATPLKPGTPI